MYSVIFFLVFLFISCLSAASKGDPSGIEAIGKFILYAVCIVGGLCILVYCPYLIIALGIVIIVLIVYSSISDRRTRTVNNHEIVKNDHVEMATNDIVESTSFQNELQKNTNIYIQTVDEQENKIITLAYQEAELDYKTIKEQLLNMAKNGMYTLCEDKRKIVYETSSSYIKKDFKYHIYETVEYHPFRSNKTIYVHSYSIQNSKHFENFMRRIKELGDEDGVTIEVIGKYKPICGNETIFTIPGGIKDRMIGGTAIIYLQATCNF